MIYSLPLVAVCTRQSNLKLSALSSNLRLRTMAPSLEHSSLSFDNIGALSQLVEAASALTELEVKEPPTIKKSHSTALVSDDDEISKVIAKPIDKTSPSSSSRKKEIFPQKLMEILADSSLSDIVSWLPHGRSFVIVRPDLFCEQVLPRYLPPADSRGSTKYPSFTRKLNRWGFRQATRGADTGAFHHPFFRRDQPELCVKMVCQKSRDRQQNNQKQRSLPPKKRSVPEEAPPAFCNTSKLLCSIISGADTGVPAGTSSRSGHLAPPVSADERSIGTSSTTSQTSFTNTLASHNAHIDSSKRTTGVPHPSATTAPVATVSPKVTIVSMTKSQGSSGMMIPFISNDQKFVASTLRQRESLEVYRAAKAMLYDAYMKAVNEEAP